MASVKTSKNAALNLYDQTFKIQPSNQLEIEMKMFAKEKSEEIGGLGKAEHFKNIIRIAYYWVWSNWHDWNELMLWAWCNYTDISVAGPGASHKTFTFSLLGAMEFFASPANTAVIMTSTTVPALKTRLWPRFKDFHNKLQISDGQGNLIQTRMPYHVQESKTMIQMAPGDDEHSIRAVAIDKGNTEKALGKIIGNHPGRVVLIIDEAAQTEQAAFDAKTNLSIGTSFFRLAKIANPISRFDSHGKGCEPKNGWPSVNVMNEEWWETKAGICLHFNGLKSPNVLLGKRRYPKLISQEDIDAIRKDPDAGENSLTWYSQVLGIWPPAGLSKTVLDTAIIDSGKAREKAVWQTGYRTIAALDPAFTTGGDKCVLRFFRVGKMIDGVVGMECTDRIHITLDASGKVPINYQIADRCREECIQRQVQPADFSYDSTSASGLGDIISQRWSSEIRRISFGGKATERAIGFGDQRKACDVYGNRVTELWFSVKRAVQAGRIRGLDDVAAAEFCTRETEMRGERLWVESKVDMKERTKGTSPDDADPVAIAADYFRDICEQELGEIQGGQSSHEDWQRLQKRYNSIHTKTYIAA